MNPVEPIPLSGIEFHNLTPEPLGPGQGVLLPRFPVQVRHALESPGFLMSQESAGGELRFVTAALHARVFLLAFNQDVEVAVFKGDFQVSGQVLKQGCSQFVHLVPPDRFKEVRAEALTAGRFHPDVWRVVLNRGTVVYQGIETFGQAVRPPRAEEKPRLRWLAYGSSITHSSMNGYPSQAARRLKVDVLNKGLSGSCYAEPEAVEFLAVGCEWDFATLELGINMRPHFAPDEFERRARHLVRRCVEAKPGRPIFLIGIFPNHADPLHVAAPDANTRNEVAFDRHLRLIAGEYRSQNVHWIEGASVLQDFSSLSADLVHPTDYGHVLMGENLARILAPFVASL